MLIFCTSSGGAGNLAQRLTRAFWGISRKSRLQRQLSSVSRTTKYYVICRISYIVCGFPGYEEREERFSMGLLKSYSRMKA